MKKLLLVLLMVLVSVAAFADHPGNGIGLILSGGLGPGWVGSFSPGLSLKLGGLPVFWGIYVPILYGGAVGVSVSGDFYFFDQNLVTKEMTNEDGTYNLKLDWYLGAGGFGGIYFWDGGSAGDIGVRMPVGVSWHVIKQFEVALGLAPGLGVYIHNNGANFGFTLPVELTFRYWW